MNFTNINDPAGVKALLEQLRASQAWQDAVTSPPENTSQSAPSGLRGSSTSGATAQSSSAPSAQAVHSSTAANLVHDPAVPPIRAPGSDLLADAPGNPTDTPSPSVASLLSQLQYSSAPATSALLPPPLVLAPPVSSVGSSLPPAPATSNHSSVLPEAHAVPPGRPVPGPRSPFTQNEDLRNLTFQQALPHLAQLAEDAGFVDAISTIRKEQADLERRLWDERAAILRKHEEKVKVARTKATLVGGTGLTQYEADVMSDAFRQELRKFDAQRVLPAWDGLVAKQQAKLEALGVPAMFSTTSGADRQRQQRVIQVLVGIAGNEDS